MPLCFAMAGHAFSRRLGVVRWAFAAFVGVVVPLSSRLEGSAALAYAMYAHAESWRMRVVAWDDARPAHEIAPTELAVHARPSALALLAGADHWRIGAPVHLLRGHLADVARLACDTAPASTRVDVTLEERGGVGDDLRTTIASRRCR